MEPYHKINAPFKRHMTGPNKGKLIVGDWALPELEYLADNRWSFTEKVDGTNIRIDMRRSQDWGRSQECIFVEYGGRTDRAVIPNPLLAYLEKVFPTYPSHRRSLNQPSYRARYDDIGSWMVESNIEHVTLYGEGYGPNIQGGGKYREDVSFVLFDVRIGNFWLRRPDVNDIAAKLDIDSVPVLGTGTLWDAIDIVSGTQTIWGEGDNYGPHPSGPLKSQWGDFTAEGIIAVPTVPMFTRAGDRIITKVKSVDFN